MTMTLPKQAALLRACLCALLISCAFTGYSKNLSADVNLSVKQNLLNDDYAENMEVPSQTTHYDQSKLVVDSGLRAVKFNNTVYAYNNQSIVIYDLLSSTWLDAMVMPEAVFAFDVDENGIYVAHSRTLYFYSYDGSSRVFIRNTSNDIKDLELVNQYLMVSTSSQYITVDTTTLDTADVVNASYRVVGQVAIDDRNKIYGRDSGLSPCDIRMIEVQELDGAIGSPQDSPYHGDYPCGTNVYAFPDGSRIASDSGVVYHATDLTYAGSLAGDFDSIDFFVDLPVVLRGQTLHLYSNTLVETGQYQLKDSHDFIFVHNENVFSFKYQVDTIEVVATPVDQIGPAVPGVAVNPIGLQYEPDSIAYDGHDLLYILSRNNLSIFVFNLSTMEYETGVGLNEAPLFMSLSAMNNKLYLAYNGGRSTQINLNNHVETGYVNTPQTACGMTAAGEYIAFCDPSGAWVSHITYGPSGNLISQEEWNYYSEEYVWSDVNRKLVHYRDSTSPNDILTEEIGVDGVIGNQMDSPYHGGRVWSYPLCVNPDGSNVIVGAGIVYDATSLVEINSLSNNIKGCAWSKGVLYTFDSATTTNLQSWSENYQEFSEGSWAGEPIDLVALNSGALAIVHSVEGVPTFDLHKDHIFTGSFD